jgi:two-component system response regulator DegU
MMHWRLDADSTSMTTTEDRPIRILLIEDEALVRAALHKLLESWPDFEVVGQVGLEEGAPDLVQRLDPDVILLALGDATENQESVRRLAAISERAKLLVLIRGGEPELSLQMVRLGARGVVQKRKDPEELRKAITIVHQGREIWLDRSSLTMLVNEKFAGGHTGTSKSRSGLELLTDRELEVVALVSEGYTNKEVGGRLFLSETTVRHHLTTIFRKLKVRNRFELLSHLHRNRFAAASEMSRLSRAEN